MIKIDTQLIYKVLTLDDENEWLGFLSQMPENQQGKFYSPHYYKLFESRKEGTAKCFVFIIHDKIALYPFLQNSINDRGFQLDENYYDIQGAYGYNGVISNTTDEDFLQLFSENFEKWSLENNIVCEFVRFNPLLKNEKLSKWINPINVLENISIPLESEEFVWNKCFHRKVREAIRKAKRIGLQYISFKGSELTDEYFDHFSDIYYHMLERNNADDFYKFDKNFFTNLKNDLSENVLFSFALYENKPISCELILFNKINAYAFLGGTFSKHFDKSANTFLRFEIVKDLIDKKVKTLNIGGGIKENDSLFKYKKSFNINESSSFYIGKHIFLKDIYNTIINQWTIKYPELVEKYNNYLLKYSFETEESENKKVSDFKKIIVLGSGGHAKVVIDILNLMPNIQIIGVTSNSIEKGNSFFGYPVIGNDEEIIKYDPLTHSIAMGLGGYRNNDLRVQAYNYVKNIGFSFINTIHPSAIISKKIKMGEGITIFPGVIINTDVEINNNVIIATGSSIDHETIIQKNTLISAGVTIGAYSIIGEECLIALGSKIISGINIANNTLVGAGAVVVKDTIPYSEMIGIPAYNRKNA